MSRTPEYTPTRREFLKGVGALAATVALGSRMPACAAETGRKPNVIFIFADQLRSQSLGCYGDKQAKTPNLDKLASEGVRFTNAISTWPVCSPYRAMLLTGRYPMSNGVVYNEYPVWDGLDSIATALKSQGYQTGYIGKWHLNGSGGESRNIPKERRLGFDHWVPVEGQMFMDAPGGGEKIWRPDMQADHAIKYIRENKDRPFCLFLSWNPPHDPYIAPDKYMKMFPPEEMELRDNCSEWDLVREQLKKHPLDPKTSQGQKRIEWRKRLETDDGLRKIKQGYYAATCGLDANMGRIMKALDEAGIADDTILVFSSDHGDMLGSHRMCLKQEPFEESISIPFILRYPKKVPKGIVSNALLAPIDVMPTLLGLAGASCPSGVEGINLADAATGKRSDQQDALLIMKMLPGGNPWMINAATEWRGVRTRTHTYARLQDGGPWVLYDNIQDPYQMKNLVNDPAHKALQEEMESKMTNLLKKAHDPFDTEKILNRIEKKSGKKTPAAAKQGQR